MTTYQQFLEAKVDFRSQTGHTVAADEVHPLLLPHQRAIVQWAVEGGRRAIFAAFGLGKTFMQLETVRLTLERVGGCGLIVCPLGVRQEFIGDARDKLGIGCHVVHILGVSCRLRFDRGRVLPPGQAHRSHTIPRAASANVMHASPARRRCAHWRQ